MELLQASNYQPRKQSTRSSRKLLVFASACAAIACLSLQPVQAQNYAQPPKAPAAQNPQDIGWSCTSSQRAIQTIRLCSPLIRDTYSSDKVRVFALMKRAKAWVVEEEIASAILDYTQVIDLDPEHTDALQERAKLYTDSGNHEAAAADFTQLIKINNKDIAAYRDRGFAYMRLKKFDAAIADLTSSIEIDPKAIDSVVGRGDVYAAMGEHDKAFKEYNDAINLDAQYWNAYFQRGALHSMRGNIELARSDYNKVLEITDFNLQAMRALQALSLYTPWKDDGRGNTTQPEQ